MWQAYFDGLKFKTLSGKIFHMNHSEGSGFNFGSNSLFKRLDLAKIKYIDNFELFKLILKIKDRKLNKKNWGYKNLNFSIKKL